MLGPSSGTNIKCIRCHQPHGSPYAPLIQETIRDETGVTYSVTGNNSTVCFACHQGGIRNYKGKNIYQMSKHGSTVLAEKASSVYPGTSYLPGMCHNCHEPHGISGFQKYTRDEGNDLCVRCHDVHPNPPENYSYRGILAYNDTPHSVMAGPPGVKSRYLADSQGFAVWEGPQDQSPHNPGEPVAPAEFTTLLEQDDTWLRTDVTVQQGDFNTQMYRFILIEPLANILKFTVKWIGYGEPTLNHPTELSIWNLAYNEGLGGWERVNSVDMEIGRAHV